MIISIGTWTLSQLQYAFVFGIGALVLFIIVPAVVMWIEEHHLDNTSHHDNSMGSVVSAISRAAVLNIGWLLFITIVLFLIVGVVNHTDTTSPAYGIWAFWNVDWLNPEVLSSLDHGSEIYIQHGERGLALAKSLAFGMTVAKFAEMAFLGFIYFILMKIIAVNYVNSTFGYRGRGGFDEISIGDIMGLIVVFMASILAFNLTIFLINESIENVLNFSNKLGKTQLANTEIDVFDDFVLLIKNGLIAFTNIPKG